MLSQDQNIMFKLENSARVIKPIAINSSDPKVMDMQFENFKVDASILLKQNKTCKHVYLLNGSPVFSLIDIPEDCSVLFLSHSPFFSKMVGESSKIFNKSPSKYKNFYLNKAFKNSSKINIRTEENEYAFNNLLDNSKMLFSNKLKESECKEIENKLSKRYTKHIPEEVITTLKVLLKGRYNSHRNKIDLCNTVKNSPIKSVSFEAGNKVVISNNTPKTMKNIERVSMKDIKRLEQRDVSMLNFELSPNRSRHQWIPCKRIKNPVFYSQSRRRRKNIQNNIKKLKMNFNELKEDEHSVLKGDTNWNKSNQFILKAFVVTS